ncbi:uncharacterized protein ARMOST_10200 [Armillaria ostoyae]|uniref:Uncharacterized protein n=1 Tax=Armillaria ostoyae TaxID=47428 RepID=A0A284RDP8_ARMOS|nr:uncharacterized protein ARMOST_10200 [Armillaria ostoyae]
MAEVEIPRAKVGDREVNTFTVASDSHSEFHEFSDVSGLVAGTIGISVLLDEGAVDSAAGAAAVKKPLSLEDLSTGAGSQLYIQHKVPFIALSPS